MVKIVDYIKEFARFLIHPDAVPRCAWNLTLGWNRQLARIHPVAHPRLGRARG